MGRDSYDEYLHEIEDEIEELESGLLEGAYENTSDSVSRDRHKRAVRKAIELHQERRRLRHDLEFFT